MVRYYFHFFRIPLFFVLGHFHLLLHAKAGESFLEKAYLKVLGRDADAAGKATYLGMAGSRFSLRWKLKVLGLFLRSPEYWCHVSRIITRQDISKLHHEARKMWVEKVIPPASNILDLGGSSSLDPDGALLSMGYPYIPEKITIIDFPPQDRTSSAHSKLREDNHVGRKGTKIEFIYDSFVNLEPYADHSYDLIVSGQSIEHVTLQEAEKIFQQCLRIVKPGGNFVLDTPNRYITELMGGSYIHPEHKIEYYPQQLVDIAKRAGWIEVEKGAISLLPISHKKRKFMPHEMNKPLLGDNADEGFSFYLSLRAPG